MESILPHIITTDEKDKVPEKGSISFATIHEWVEKECVETGRDIVEKLLKEIYSQGRISELSNLRKSVIEQNRESIDCIRQRLHRTHLIQYINNYLEYDPGSESDDIRHDYAPLVLYGTGGFFMPEGKKTMTEIKGNEKTLDMGVVS